MTLIKCRECGHDVSTESEACPNCGCPVNKNEAAPDTDNSNKQPDPITITVDINPIKNTLKDCIKKLKDFYSSHKKATLIIAIAAALLLALLIALSYYQNMDPVDKAIEVDMNESVDTDLYGFTVLRGAIIPMGSSKSCYGKEYLAKDNLMEYQITVNARCNSTFDFNRFDYNHEASHIVINGEYKYYSNASRGNALAGGSAEISYAFAVPADVLKSAQTIDFYFLFDNKPGESTGAMFSPQVESDGISLNLSESDDVSCYKIRVYTAKK